jgi:hypothetical protein
VAIEVKRQSAGGSKEKETLPWQTYDSQNPFLNLDLKVR